MTFSTFYHYCYCLHYAQYVCVKWRIFDYFLVKVHSEQLVHSLNESSTHRTNTQDWCRLMCSKCFAVWWFQSLLQLLVFPFQRTWSESLECLPSHIYQICWVKYTFPGSFYRYTYFNRTQGVQLFAHFSLVFLESSTQVIGCWNAHWHLFLIHVRHTYSHQQ